MQRRWLIKIWVIKIDKLINFKDNGVDMLKSHEVKSIIKDAFEELTDFVSSVREDQNGNLILIFKEDSQSNDKDIYSINITYFNNMKEYIDNFISKRKKYKDL